MSRPIVYRVITMTVLWLVLSAPGGCVNLHTVAYVANSGNNHVQILDLVTGETVNKLYTGAAPWRLIESPDKKRLVVQHWYSETSAVVDLATNQIQSVLPVRGPGVFSPEGDRFWSYSWPGSFLQSFEGRTFKTVDQKQTEDRSVYDMLFWGRDRLYLGQYDPMTKVGRTVYDHVRSTDLSKKDALASEIQSGTSPARLVMDPTGQFLLTANMDDRSVSLINRNGAGAKVTVSEGPRDIFFSPDGKRMVVLCWKPGASFSDIFTLETDFSVRPWPTFKALLTQHIPGGLVAGTMDPEGRVFYALDRPGKRLVVYDLESLSEVKAFPVGDDPSDFVIRQVLPWDLERLAGKSEARERLEKVISLMKSKSEAFTDAAFTETLTVEIPEDGGATKGEGSEQSPKMKTVTSITKTMIRLPDSVRQELSEGGVRLAEKGRAVVVSKEGRFNNTPRQDLLYVLYAVYGLPADEAIRHLAGDVPGSVNLRNGMAVDLVHEVEEEGHRYYAIGVSEAKESVSQLWVSTESGLPVSLVEQFPVMRPRNPHGQSQGFGGMTETRFTYEKVDGRYLLPVRMTRYLDGKEVGIVKLSDIRVNQNPSQDAFDLTRLGGVARANFRSSKALQASDGPGLAVPSMGNNHIETPFIDHKPYNSNPPTSGPHTPYLAEWGVHRLPIPPEVQVHNLEDGGVLIQYACPTPCIELVKQLEAMVEVHDRVIVAPYPLMDHRIALTAWGRIETMDEMNEDRIVTFIKAYAGKDHHPAGGESATQEARK